MVGGNLFNVLPRLGFVWPRGLGFPRILRTDGRDAAVWAAVVALAGVRLGRPLRRREALPVLESAFGELAVLSAGGEYGLEQSDIVSWLFGVRRSGRIPLASAINANTWVEFVMRVVDARLKYKRTVTPVIQAGNQQNLSGFAREVDRFWSIIEQKWLRDTVFLMMVDEPDLFGESLDWDGDEEDWDPSSSQN
ncbi:hypothetical protein V8F20_003319 [Naviculisporaceae sp. PSN 640]